MDKYLRREYHGQQIDLSKINEKKTCLGKNYWDYREKNTPGYLGGNVETNVLFVPWIGSESKSYCPVSGKWVHSGDLDSYAAAVILDDDNEIQDIEFYIQIFAGYCGGRDYKKVKKVPDFIYHDFWEEMSNVLVGW